MQESRGRKPGQEARAGSKGRSRGGKQGRSQGEARDRKQGQEAETGARAHIGTAGPSAKSKSTVGAPRNFFSNHHHPNLISLSLVPARRRGIHFVAPSPFFPS